MNFSRCTLKIPGALQFQRQANLFFEKSRNPSRRVARKGWRFGRARLAVRAADQFKKSRPCVYCGMCLYGCPYGCIYNSADTVNEMRADANF